MSIDVDKMTDDEVIQYMIDNGDACSQASAWSIDNSFEGGKIMPDKKKAVQLIRLALKEKKGFYCFWIDINDESPNIDDILSGKTDKWNGPHWEMGLQPIDFK